MDINYQFLDQGLLTLALSHPSVKGAKSYERLEFLGDAVLGMIIAEILYKKFPDIDEGKLSRMLSSLIKTNTLNEVAKKINLGSYLIMDKGEEASNGRTNPRNLENALEALIGAIYLDGGLLSAKTIVLELWVDFLNTTPSELMLKDAKSKLQEWAQKNGKPIPKYTIQNIKGENHDPVFKVSVSIEGAKSKTGTGKTKKLAQQEAASKMLVQEEVQ